MKDGAAMLRTDWLGGRWLEGREIGIKLPCGRFPQSLFMKEKVMVPLFTFMRTLYESFVIY
jgi:hypothetical protein